ncbi:hypothetical protein ACFLXQ_05245 [Chloroflexota bacterium]
MELSEILYEKTNRELKELAKLCDSCQGATRKNDLVRCIHRTVMQPESLRQVWSQLDELSKKVIAAAYHNEGEFDQSAFVAQYGSLPVRPRSSSWYAEPILLDLFIYHGQLPSDLMPLLTDLVPPPDKFQLTGLVETPTALEINGFALDLMRADTELVGLHDLLTYLRLVDQGRIKITATSGRATGGSIKKILAGLLDEEFFPLPEKYRANQTIRPFGLDVFAQGAGLASKARGRNELQLTKTGREFYQTQAPEILLEAFETWTQAGHFDELSRISGLKGQKARGTRLTKPASRREAIIEALSWCPVGVWINIQDFYRALKIWHFDFEVENTYYSNLYVGYKEYGFYGDTYWTVAKGLYVNAVLWEYLGSIGALDLLYTHPEDADLNADYLYHNDDYLSLYDGLQCFRINNLGAYLLGQASEYVPTQPLHQALFTILDDLRITLLQPDDLTPNDRSLLEQIAVPIDHAQYRLDTPQLLTALEAGADLGHLAGFLQQRHSGPLPEEVTAWLEQIRQNSQAFTMGGQAIFIKAQSAELAQMVLDDPVLKKFCHLTDRQTFVIPARREKAFRARLKELAYILQ